MTNGERHKRTKSVSNWRRELAQRFVYRRWPYARVSWKQHNKKVTTNAEHAC